MARAMATAKQKDKRVLVVWGADKERRELDALLKACDRETLDYEYELLRLSHSANRGLGQMAVKGLPLGPALSVFDPLRGDCVVTYAPREYEAADLKKFLEHHKVPVKDAEKIWRDALARAQREKKNLLVHLGAPW